MDLSHLTDEFRNIVPVDKPDSPYGLAFCVWRMIRLYATVRPSSTVCEARMR